LKITPVEMDGKLTLVQAEICYCYRACGKYL